jgi:hypothetical protein
MADRWTNERDREWRERGARYEDWRDRQGRRTEGYGRAGEGRSWEDEDDYSSRMGVTSGGAVYQSGRGGGRETPRFASQDYTGGRQGGERDRGAYGQGRGYGQGYRGESAAQERQRRYPADRSRFDDDDQPAFAYFERYEARSWDLDDERQAARDYERPGAERYGAERREDRYARGREEHEEARHRGERRDHDEHRGEGAGDFLQRAGERISNWFRGDNLMHGSREEDRDEGRYYRSDYGRERRPLHRGVGPKGYQRSDERISDEVHQRLTDDPWIDASEIDVEVKSGEVTLTGHVDNREAKHRAERLIEDLSGVRHVQNNLRVNPNAGLTSAGRGYGSSVLEAQMRRNEQATDPGNNGVSGLSGRTSTGAAAERSTTDGESGGKRS